MGSDFYVYLWTGPTGSYIGKGRGKRAKSHMALAERGSKASPLFYRAIRKYGRGSFRLSFLRQGLTEPEAFLDERLCIYLQEPRYNLSDGGEGPSGMSHTPETRQRMSRSHKGSRHLPETRAKIAASNSGKTPSIETRQKISSTLRSVPENKRSSAVRLVVDLGLAYKDASRLSGCSVGTIWRAVAAEAAKGTP